MEDSIRELTKYISGFCDTPNRKRAEEIIPIFLNRKRAGNRLLLLGLNDMTLIDNQLGFHADDFFKDEAKYSIKVIASNKDRILISFVTMDNEPSAGEKNDIIDMYRVFGQIVDASWINNTLPPLTIQHDIDWLARNPNKCLSRLMNQGTVDNVTVYTSHHRGEEGLASSINEMCIITRGNWTLSENAAKNEQDHEKFQTYWEYQATIKNAIQNPLLFNFVVLNSGDDHLLRVFHELMTDYKEHYCIDECCSSLINRVFFISNHNLLEHSRFRESNSINEEEIRNLRQNISDLETDICDVEAYSNILEVISSNKSNFDVTNGEHFLEAKDNSAKCLKQLANEMEYVKGYIADYEQLYQKIAQIPFFDNYVDANADKESFFTSLKDYLESLKCFSEKFCSKELKQIEILLGDCDKDKDKLSQEPSGWVSRLFHKMICHSRDLKKCVDKWNKNVHDIKNKIEESVSISEWDELEVKLSSAENQLSNFSMKFSPENQIGIEYVKVEEQYKSSIDFAKSEINRIHRGIKHKSLFDGSVTQEFENLITSKALNISLTSTRMDEKIVNMVKAQSEAEKYLRNIIRSTLVRLASPKSAG